MSKIKNDGLDQYGAEQFEQQQFGTAGVEGVNKAVNLHCYKHNLCSLSAMHITQQQQLQH